ncbi:Aldehyde dehydrogenase family protein [Paracoccus halophilus]|uniref:Aldehyde dehydrogenase family protein n=1 Tax=Paracoccus halophilus TaxID=376733 RepID=A0A099F3S5_9RHOB|nr:aldehyde dehydrogenase family protein [Paracoccus halophilus]KGJ05014.1 hypothetical protein IT41_08340 [Paracoccus halophilus]SFA39790.1 Aldehyde dehydrogenase family protein [Paracoccus halophilus]
MCEALLEREHTIFLAGEWRHGHGAGPLEVIDPGTGAVLSRLRHGSAADVDKSARATYLRDFARGLEARRDYLVGVQMHSNGKPRAEAPVAKTRALRIGSPVEEGTEIGPITTSAQCHKVLWMVEEAKSDGLDCLTGGAIDRDGQFVKPTIFRDVPRDHMIWHTVPFMTVFEEINRNSPITLKYNQ